ncbi:hypothetical protein [Alistipes finegoldii]|jgi:hypothetical protein|uniref:hypothetical protein n=1 Tax=Alistipes finegoldii TaxID=214856 RepID=UPI00206D33C6|nr:MAG TPA: L20 Mitochondrial ribosomal protein subunit L20 [Caudoviricetes sp.]
MMRVKKWTREELFEMKRLYPTFFNKALAELFGRSPKAIAICAARLNLKKSSAFIESCRRLPGRFQKGHIPYNKGIKGMKKKVKRRIIADDVAEQRKWLDCMPNPFENMKGLSDWEYAEIQRTRKKQ